jgi:hypothetical protein
LSPDEADRFVAEQTAIGALLGADPMPTTAAVLSEWVADHPEVGSSPEMEDVVDFLTNPPLPLAIKVGYAALLEAAVAILPKRLAGILGVSPKPGAELGGRAAVASLRWALGYSPSWALALHRTGASLPEGVFRRLPQDLAAS